MPTPVFQRIALDAFTTLLAQYPFTRRINAVHLHHTWRPSRRDFKGHETIVSMWRFHTQQMGWRDIAQHVSIDPEGFVWLGRNWNLPPVSASGHNGNERFGPFMLEMIGNFDRGCDSFDGPQRETALEVVAQVQARFGLPPDSLVFHNAMSGKTCPGSALDFAQVRAEVETRRMARMRPARRSRDAAGPFPDEPDAALRDAIEALSRVPSQPMEAGDAEFSHDESGPLETLDGARLGAFARPAAAGGAAGRAARLDAGTLAALRPHLVNLSMGRFSTAGEASTTPADVDAIFEQWLPRAFEAARAQGRKLRVLFYAHGGLVPESDGLAIAARHVDWWKRNDVYPIHFVWETGLFETIGDLLFRARRSATRDLARDVWDHTLDPLIEAAARRLRGPQIWAGMKSSAEHAVDEPSEADPAGGGALYVARRLKAFCDAHRDGVELHAAGHSAGSIFHAYFLPAAHALGVPAFASAHFLAPAIRVDLFKERLGERVGAEQAVHKLTLFTMQKDYEKGDDCGGLYHKSLLYLVSNALENERETPLLGLEESLRADAALKSLFGLGNALSPHGEVIWSVTASDTGASASTACSHGAFDDDAPTMNSLARRVLGKADADAIVEFEPSGERAAPRSWIDETDWIYGEAGAGVAVPGALWTPAASASTTPSPAVQPAPASSAPISVSSAASAARRLALCVGIDRYPDPRNQLSGCVADARMWSDALKRLGFATRLLTDREATREAIERELMGLVASSRSGDVLVFQYSGHGTHLPDLDSDEDDREDEAICPVDFASGAFYIDDDIARVFARIPDGVAMTVFMDCCHSGTNSRFAIGAPNGHTRSMRDERKRFVAPTPELVAAHRRFRQQAAAAKRALDGGGTGGRSRMRDVKFAACLDGEVAWESDGHGEFTLRATRILASGIDAMSNEAFARRITEAFGAQPRQHPALDCAEGVGSLALLQPVARAEGVPAATLAPAMVPAPASADGRAPGAGIAPLNGRADDALLQQTLASIQQLVQQLAMR